MYIIELAACEFLKNKEMNNNDVAFIDEWLILNLFT